jgi:hypothetical protein
MELQCERVIKYYYESHKGDGTLSASTDEGALDQLKKKFGESLDGLISVSVEQSEYHSRLVWLSSNNK